MKNKPTNTIGDLPPCMDYLYGDIAGNEFKAACHYEYARESAVLRRAAQLLRDNPEADDTEIFFQLESEDHDASWLINVMWTYVWRCPSFPAKSWNELSEAERTELLYGLPFSTSKVQPLRLGELMFLTHYLDKLNKLADSARAELKESTATGKPRQKVYPILELKNTPFVQVLLPLDFSKSRERLRNEIDLWLRLPENKARFDKHKPKTEVGTEKEARDRLKDLTAWRLYREHGCDKALSFAEGNRKRDEYGKPRPFHDPRHGQSKKVPANEAPLYSEQSGFLKAKKRALSYRAELIPWEFGKYAEEAKALRQEIGERFEKALKQARKVSKKIS